jgi:DNA-binding transcriptional ArsR family regulator
MDITTSVNSLAALAHETRLDIYRYLIRKGPDGDVVGNIADHFGLPGATLSFHLKTLKQAELLNVRRKSRSLIYSPNFEQMNALLAYLMDDCCGGQCGMPADCINTNTGDKE